MRSLQNVGIQIGVIIETDVTEDNKEEFDALVKSISNNLSDMNLPSNGIELGITMWSNTPSTKYIVASQFIFDSLKTISCFSAIGFTYLSFVYSLANHLFPVLLIYPSKMWPDNHLQILILFEFLKVFRLCSSQ